MEVWGPASPSFCELIFLEKYMGVLQMELAIFTEGKRPDNHGQSEQAIW